MVDFIYKSTLKKQALESNCWLSSIHGIASRDITTENCIFIKLILCFFKMSYFHMLNFPTNRTYSMYLGMLLLNTRLLHKEVQSKAYFRSKISGELRGGKT